MRLLIACPQCHRQFDVGARPIGSRFRCHCGSVVTVRQPRGHNAAVVRCSSCGAPRQQSGMACSHCGSDFTLHERDLDTICPGCFARISDRAKFCHHCGLALRPEALAGEKTALTCPICGKMSRLCSRKIGEVALMECGRCAGFWLGANILEHLVQKAATDFPIEDFRLHSVPRRTSTLDSSSQRGPMYRKCPVCGKLMNRRHFARRSGVIIDICKSHGVWFDADELPRILAWVRVGGKAESDRRAADEAEHKNRLDSIAKTAEWQREARRYGYDPLGGHPNSMSILASFAAWLFR
ncbi:MAG: zf-TFIIB domain-containing protein [Planctomycetes bacterium]|nr:zf-TFIIB domain-containing protein [Planctomycetota bacterium]MBU4399390.1 zf-TFIIB domain-containing protein [Planctomycetota bacterium]MCG2684624.1 zf-TFIIB domain-containing protein [Planctomycetales bacterium]